MNLRSLFLISALSVLISLNTFPLGLDNTNTPDLVYVDHTIDDDDNGSSNGDDDGQAEAGESIEMHVGVVNNGDQNASNVTATISCSDADIIITDDTEIIGTIFMGATAWTESDFDFDVTANCPEKDVTFNLALSSDQGTWEDSFTVHIYPVSGPPSLSYSSHIIDDDTSGGSDGDGDGLVEGGETVEIQLAILNSGGNTAHNVSAILSCSDADITILDDTEGFGSIAAGLIGWTNNDFDFEVDQGAVEKDVVFTINITADEGNWTDEFTIHIFPAGLPDIAYHNHLIDDDDNGSSDGDGDGIAESGESIELELSVFNSGEAKANNVVAILSCTDPDIIIMDNSESFGDILVGSEAWSNHSYDFDIDPSCPDKEVTFQLAISSDEGTWNSSFVISITNPGSPEMEFANLTIDDDNSGSSNGDGDGIPEAGEIIEFPIQIHNIGIITATGISAIISTTDVDINIADPFEYFEDITPGNTGWCNNDYDIEVDANCPEKDVLFTIEITADQGTWTDSFVIHISEQGTPELSFDALLVDDDNEGNSNGNGNAMAEPGEHIELPISIQNIGDANAHNVSAVLSTNDPFINVSDPNENYGTIIAGASEWSSNEFDFSVDNDCPDKDVLFTLTINSDEGVWSSNIIIHVFITGTPDLSYASHIIDDDNNGTSQGDGDGNPEPGEEIEMPLAITNTGTAPVHNVVGIITCTDTDITITDDSENFGTILPGETEWSNLDYDFAINYGTVEKDIVFNIEIQSDEGIWNDTFLIHVYPPSGYPDIQYVSHIIDDDDNGASNGNGDGVPSAGESIQLPVVIENIGTAAAHDVSAILSCSDSDITITDANESYPDMNVGEAVSTNHAYDFDISPTCPDKVVTFNLLVTANEGSYNTSFTMDIIGAGTPHLIFSNYIIDDDEDGQSNGDGDGFAEPGESIELPILINNIGDGPVHNVEGELTCTDPDIAITDDYENFGDVTESSQTWSNNDFDFEISETCPEKDVLFTLTLEGDEGVWVLTFTIHITPLIYYDVMSFANPTNGGITEGDGTFLENESCSLTATALEGHAFTNWTHNGAIVSDLLEYTFVVTENTVLIANFLSNEYEIIVDGFPAAGGNVSGGGIYQYNETATVNATPNADYTFTEWTVGGETVSTNASYSFVVTEEVSLIAHFQGELYVIQATANPSNGGTVSGDGEYESGSTATLIANPEDNYNFINWTENGTIVSSDISYSFQVSSNRSLEANFSEDYFTIDAIAVPVGGGPIEGTGNYTSGQTATLSTTPNGGYYFIDWKENGNTVSVNTNYTFQVSGNRSLEAHFGTLDYEVTVVANPAEAGEVSGAGNFNFNDEVTVLATPNSGWQFLSWTNNGTVVSNNAEYTFNITVSMDLQANFIIQEYTITALVEPGTGGSVSGDGIYDYGETAILHAIPSNGYDFLYWTENNDVVSNEMEYSFTVTANRILKAHFQIQEFEIITLASPSTGGNVFGGGVFEFGTSITVEAVSQANYDFIGWTEFGNTVSVSSNYSFSVLENRELTAVFEFVEAINRVNESLIKVYPNPSDGIFNLQLSIASIIEIYDDKGLLISELKVNSGINRIDLSKQADGIYFIKLITIDGLEILKILKE